MQVTIASGFRKQLAEIYLRPQVIYVKPFLFVLGWIFSNLGTFPFIQ